jgi:hypothetical protein
MGDWEPDQVIRVGTQVGYYWKVPARVEGRWRLDGIEESGASALLELVQRHQRLAGTIAIGGRSQPLLSPEIDGTRVMLRYVDSGGLLKALALTVRGEGLEGEVVPPYGMVENPGEPVRVRARRVQSGG